MSTAAEKRAARAAAKAAKEAQLAAKPDSSAAELTNAAAVVRPDLVPSAHGTDMPVSAASTVTVAVKLGVAFFELRLFELHDVDQQTQTGVRTVKEARPMVDRNGNRRIVRVRGTAYPRGTPPAGYPAPPIIADGAALNPGIDRDFWDEWLRQNQKNPLVRNGLIYGHENVDNVRAHTRERKDQLSGLEPINPKGDPRMVKPTRGDLSPVETEEGQKNRINTALASAIA